LHPLLDKKLVEGLEKEIGFRLERRKAEEEENSRKKYL